MEGDGLLKKGGGTERQQHKLSTIGATALLCTWSTASSNLMMPWTFGQLGLVAAPLLMLVIQGLALLVTLDMVHAAIQTKAATSADLGFRLGGAVGRLVLQGSQVANQLLWLPVAIIVCVDAAQVLLSDFSWSSRAGQYRSICLKQFISERSMVTRWRATCSPTSWP